MLTDIWFWKSDIRLLFFAFFIFFVGDSDLSQASPLRKPEN